MLVIPGMFGRARIVNTIFPTEDIVVADWVVMDTQFGADTIGNLTINF
jgi:hypothetical protein